MPEVRYFWNIEAVPIPNLSNHSIQYACQKLRDKFGNGEIVVVGDEACLNEDGGAAGGVDMIPLFNFIHAPGGQQNASSELLLDKIKEISWKKGDVLVLLTAEDSGFTTDVMNLKTKGVVVSLVGNKKSQLQLPVAHGNGMICHFSISKDCMSKENLEKLHQLTTKVHEAALRSQVYQWTDILAA